MADDNAKWPDDVKCNKCDGPTIRVPNKEVIPIRAKIIHDVIAMLNDLEHGEYPILAGSLLALRKCPSCGHMFISRKDGK